MRTLLSLSVVFMLALPAFALAQQRPEANAVPYKPLPLSGAEAIEVKEEWRRMMEQKKASTTNFIKARHEELKNVFGPEREAVLRAIGEKREELKMLFKDKLASTTDLIKQRRLQFADEGQKQRADLLERYFAKAGEMFQGHIDRLSNLADKMAARIEKLEDEKGADLSQAKELLAQAQEKLEEASAKADEFSDAVVEALEAGQGGEAAQAMKALRMEVWEAVKGAHEALVQALRAIKASLGEQTATSTTQQ